MEQVCDFLLSDIEKPWWLLRIIYTKIESSTYFDINWTDECYARPGGIKRFHLITLAK